METLNPIGVSVKVCPIITPGRSVQRPKVFSFPTKMILSGLGFLFLFGFSGHANGLQAQPFNVDREAPKAINEGPKIIKAAKPAYPPIAAARRISGKVVVGVDIDVNGRVTEAHAQSGHPILLTAAQSAALRWRFNSARQDVGIRSAKLIFNFLKISSPNQVDGFTAPYQMVVRWEGTAVKTAEILPTDSSSSNDLPNESSLIKRTIVWLRRALLSPFVRGDVKNSTTKPKAVGVETTSNIPPQISPCNTPIKYENRNQIDPPPLAVDSVSGRIFSEVGELGGSVREIGPVDTACIGLFTEQDHRLIAFTSSDDEGLFRLNDVPAGRYRLVVRAEPFCVANLRLVVRRRNGGDQMAIYMRAGEIDSCSYANYATLKSTSFVRLTSLKRTDKGGRQEKVRAVPTTFSYPASPVTRQIEKPFEVGSLMGRITNPAGEDMADVLVERVGPDWETRVDATFTDLTGKATSIFQTCHQESIT